VRKLLAHLQLDYRVGEPSLAGCPVRAHRSEVPL